MKNKKPSENERLLIQFMLGQIIGALIVVSLVIGMIYVGNHPYMFEEMLKSLEGWL